MHKHVEQAYETLRANGHYPLLVVSINDVKEYIKEYAQHLSPSDDQIMLQLAKLWRNWDSGDEWLYAVKRIMNEIEDMESDNA